MKMMNLGFYRDYQISNVKLDDYLFDFNPGETFESLTLRKMALKRLIDFEIKEINLYLPIVPVNIQLLIEVINACRILKINLTVWNFVLYNKQYVPQEIIN